jgi:hypothetical protein
MRVAAMALSLVAAFAGAADHGWAGHAAASQRLSVAILPFDSVPVGRPATVGILITNRGGEKVVRIKLWVAAPPWVRLARKGCRMTRRGLECRLGAVPAHGRVIVRLTATPLQRGDYRLTVDVAAQTVGADARAITVSTSRFRAAVTPIDGAMARRMTGVSWRSGCPVGLSDLRVLTVSRWGFDGDAHVGTLIVHRDVAASVVRVMRRLFALRFPIRRMQTVDAYGGSDFRSIEADNTSAFNCRPVAGTSRWSEHAYGRAIDLNPIENPYVSAGGTSHVASRRYLDRSLQLPGMVHAGDAVVRAFASIGWAWGGAWNGGVRDYQHFSASGR